MILNAGDHAENLAELVMYSIENRLVFSDIAVEELRTMHERVMIIAAIEALNRDINMASVLLKEKEKSIILKNHFAQAISQD